jgi:hypothetical protein
MIRPFFTFLLISVVIKVFSQDKSLERFYIYDSVIKKNRVAKQIDTVGDDYIREYDGLGREVAAYRKGDKEIYRSKYFNREDTIVCLHYVNGGKRSFIPVAIEKYVYSRNNRILYYHRSTKGSGKNEIEVYKFFYDEKERPMKVISYFHGNYPFPIHFDTPIIDTLLNPSGICLYFYDSNGRKFYKKQMDGREDFQQVDTFYTDNKGRLLKMVSFQKEGYWGEWRASNIYNIEEFQYQKNKILTKEYGYATTATLDEKQVSYDRQYETLYYPTGLVAKITIIEGKKNLAGSSFIYRHFPNAKRRATANGTLPK